MEYVQNNKLNALYEYIKDGNDYASLLGVPLPEEFRLPNHPDPFLPVRAIVEFLEMDGESLFKAVADGDYAEVYRWSKNPQHSLFIQHPITGNTIFHLDSTLTNIFQGAEELMLVSNWLGHNSF